MDNVKVAKELIGLAKSLMAITETPEEKKALKEYLDAALELEKEFKDFNKRYLNAINQMMRAKTRYKGIGDAPQRKLREEVAQAKADFEAAIKKLVFGAKLLR